MGMRGVRVWQRGRRPEVLLLEGGVVLRGAGLCVCVQ